MKIVVPSIDVARDAAVHVGAHLVVFTPIMPWGSEEPIGSLL
jgi:hypothetical protein